ncbi:hypothetical protein LGK95_00305 [Clostridium algoriphilum]|uniref:hypothetical protein n=1 Tax=Clostridium algoriphilum TaxID=198347 RepID=UPI001CF1D7A5|nr:hypothetical protein [Clostridium algoriphilum]MCB2291979.1 hypothetical protein [Clostridium algoriphilum]
MKKAFIPNWYIDKKNQLRYKKFKICIVIMLIVNILLMSFILNTSNKVKNIESDIALQKKKINVVEGIKKSNIVKQDVVIIERYNELSNFMKQNNINYNNIIITKTDLEMDIEAKNYEEYITAIGCIENNYSIKILTPNNKNKGNFNFKVTIGV